MAKQKEAVIVLSCPACGAAVEETAKSCGYCMNSLLIDGREATVVRPQVDPEAEQATAGKKGKKQDWFKGTGAIWETPAEERDDDWVPQLNNFSQLFQRQVSAVMQHFNLQSGAGENNSFFGRSRGKWVQVNMPEKVDTRLPSVGVRTISLRRAFAKVRFFTFSVEEDENGHDRIVFDLRYDLAKVTDPERVVLKPVSIKYINERSHNNTTTGEVLARETLRIRFPRNFPKTGPEITLRDTDDREQVRWQLGEMNNPWLAMPKKWYPKTDDLTTTLDAAFQWLVWYALYFEQ